VEKRIQEPSDRTDLLARLQQAKDVEGKPMGRAELTAELLTQLIAGSDSTAKYVPRLPSRCFLKKKRKFSWVLKPRAQ
jgi:hypothetical protein